MAWKDHAPLPDNNLLIAGKALTPTSHQHNKVKRLVVEFLPGILRPPWNNN